MPHLFIFSQSLLAQPSPGGSVPAADSAGGSPEQGWDLVLASHCSRACQGSGTGCYLDTSVLQLGILRRLLSLFPSPTAAEWYPEVLWEMDEVRVG